MTVLRQYNSGTSTWDPVISGVQGVQGVQGVNGQQFSSINTQTGTSYTPVLSDATIFITLNNASAISFTIPTNASVAYPVGTQLNIIQLGAGQVTISAVTSGTTTINSAAATSASPKLRVQYSSASAIKIATDSWCVVGDIQ
jgi:hypothetical protein